MSAYCKLADLLKLRLNAKYLRFSYKTNANSNYLGGKKSLFKGRGIDFEEVRAYTFGDDIRAIDWRVTARKMKPHTKIFQEEREKPHMIILDQTKSMMFGSSKYFKSVAACYCASMIAWSILMHADRIGGVLFNDNSIIELKPKRSQSSIVSLLSHAAKMSEMLVNNNNTDEPAEENYLNKALRHTRRVAKSGMQLFIISDFYSLDKETEANLSQLSRHNQLVLVLIADPLEKELPIPGLYSISNGAEQHQINASNKKLRNNFTDLFHDKMQRLTKLTEKYGIPIITINSSEAIEPQLINAINRKTTTMEFIHRADETARFRALSSRQNMNTVTNPLDQLKPNIMPEAIGWWPIAYGWWVVAIVVLFSTTFITIKLLRYWLKNRYRKVALKQLKTIYANYDDEANEHELVHNCNRLLKQIALRTYPDKTIAKLCGTDWLDFLAKTAEMPDFVNGNGEVLGDLRFKSKIKVDTLTLHNLVKTWIQKHYV